MQRWILLGLVAVLLVVSAGGFGVWQMRQNRPDQQWVPMPVNAESSKLEREETILQIQRAIMEESVLQRLTKELSLQSRWELNSEQEAIDRLKSSIFVREGEMRHPVTQEVFPSIDVGVSGKRKEKPILADIAVRLVKETRARFGMP